MNIFGVRGTCLLLLLVVTVGCQDSKGYRLAPVSGVVTLDGQPLANGFVNFQPVAEGDDTNPGPGSTAICDQQGKFELATINEESGAVVGRHRVRIYSVSHRETTVSDEDTRGAPKERVPERYNYRSDLEFVVESGDSNQADFELSTN